MAYPNLRKSIHTYGAARSYIKALTDAKSNTKLAHAATKGEKQEHLHAKQMRITKSTNNYSVKHLRITL